MPVISALSEEAGPQSSSFVSPIALGKEVREVTVAGEPQSGRNPDRCWDLRLEPIAGAAAPAGGAEAVGGGGRGGG